MTLRKSTAASDKAKCCPGTTDAEIWPSFDTGNATDVETIACARVSAAVCAALPCSSPGARCDTIEIDSTLPV